MNKEYILDAPERDCENEHCVFLSISDYLENPDKPEYFDIEDIIRNCHKCMELASELIQVHNAEIIKSWKYSENKHLSKKKRK